MVVDQDRAVALAEEIGRALGASRRMLATAESCTGGWLAQALTSVAGSSAWFERGFVTYSNDAKRELLDVNPAVLSRFGAVSEQTAEAMAAGALAHSRADLAVAVTGIAGPGGGTPQKPVGTVCLAWVSRQGQSRSTTVWFKGDRQAVRLQAVVYALEGVLPFAR